MRLDDLALLVRIVEMGQLAAAGRELGLSPATVSQRLAGLEEQFGAALLVRTTRSIRLTDEGRLLLDGARRLLAEAEELKSRIRHGSERLSGPIRLSAPQDLGRRRIVPIVDAFLDDHPAVTVDLDLTDRYADLVGQGLDFAIRHGVLGDSALKARSLGENRRAVCAAPSYLAANGVPTHPEDLTRHDCIVMRFGRDADREWTFLVEGERRRVAIGGRRTVSDGALARAWCKAGRGIALKSIHDVDEDLATGALVEILREFSSGLTALQIVYPASLAQPRRVRLLIERIAAAFGQPVGAEATGSRPA